MSSTSVKKSHPTPKRSARSHDRPASHKVAVRARGQDIVVASRELASLMVKVEHKAPVPSYKGSDAPCHLGPRPLDYRLTDTKESALLRSAMSRMFAGKWYEFRLATAVNMSSTGAGAVNALINVNVLQSNSDFISLAGVFSEFFVKSMVVKWEPASMYNYPLGGAVGTNVSSLPLGVADLQHSLPAYTSMSQMTENLRYAHENTGRPFVATWRNTEDIKSTVLPNLTTAVTQSWALTSNVADYTGSLQFITQSPPPALPTSQVLGTFLVEYDVTFRNRE